MTSANSAHVQHLKPRGLEQHAGGRGERHEAASPAWSRAATRNARSVFTFTAARRRVWSFDAQSGRKPRRCRSASIRLFIHGGAVRALDRISASRHSPAWEAEARSTTSLVMSAGFEPLLSEVCQELRHWIVGVRLRL